MKEFNLFKNREKINFKGRTAFVNQRLCCDFTASGFEFSSNFNNTDLYVTCEFFGELGLIGIIIDNDFENMTELPIVSGCQKINLYKNLSGNHTVKIVKLLEYRHGRIEFESLIFNGELAEKPKERTLKFEFYGDSLTCGYGNLSSTRNTPAPFGLLEHGYKTWCVLLCEKMNAEMSAVSSSGQGIVTDCTGNPEGTIEKYWDMAVPSLDIKWDFSNQPDFVFINLCANDVNYLRFVENAKMDWNVFKQKAKNLINGIRENAPECKIVIAIGFDSDNDYFKLAAKAYEELIKNYNNIVLYTDIKCNQLGGDWHPNLDDDKMMFETLYNHLKQDFDF